MISSARASGLASLLSTHRSYPVFGYRYWRDASAEPDAPMLLAILSARFT